MLQPNTRFTYRANLAVFTSASNAGRKLLVHRQQCASRLTLYCVILQLVIERPVLYMPVNCVSKLKCSCMSQVLRAVVSALPVEPAVTGFMCDFKAAIWKALGQVFPDTVIKGYVFHFMQAIWRHVQQYGLQQAYNAKTNFYAMVR